LGLEEAFIKVSLVLFKDPWILEPVKPEVELPETKLGRTGRTGLILGMTGTEPELFIRPLGACPRAGATIPSMKMSVRISAPVRLQIICMILLLRRTGHPGTIPPHEEANSLRIF
jgi:hypothetical protein